MRRWILVVACVSVLALLPLTGSAATSTQTLTTTENDPSNSFLSTTCSPNAANAIFTSGTFTLDGVVDDSGVVLTSLLTGAAANGPSPNQVAGNANYIGAHANAFVNFTGQLKCDSASAGRVTSLVGTVYVYDAVGNSVNAYKFTPTVRTATLTLDFTNQTLALDVSGAVERITNPT
jgi:hypothetical protein